MGREKDKLWEYVKPLEDGRISCLFCEKHFAGGITRVRYHLAGLKGHDIKPCLKVRESVRNAASQEIRASDNSRKTKIVSTSSPRKKSKTFHPPKVAGVCKTDKSKVNTSLVRFLVSNNLSLDVSTLPYLGDLLSNVAEVGHGYELATYSELQSQKNLDAEKEIEEYIGKTKKLFTKTGCTLIISEVEINSKVECLNFFVCSPGGWFLLEKVRIPEEGMTFRSFKNNVCRIIKELGPENVVQVILDDPKNCMERCFTEIRGDNFFSEVKEVIQREYAWIYLSRCATGELWQILLHICSKVRWIRETIQSAKQIFKDKFEHNNTLQLPRKQQHPRNKEYSCSEKYKIAIEFSMLNSILQTEKELKPLPITMAPASNEGEGLSSENDAAMFVQKYSTDFWSNGKKVVQVLQPVFQVLELLDDYESTSGYLNEALKRVEDVLKKHLDGKDWSEVLRAWRSRLVQPVHEVAGFLNPAYACGLNFFHDYEIKMVSDSLMLLVSDTERKDLLKEVQLYYRKDSDLFNEGAMAMLKTLHPRKWWECHGDRYPLLQKIAVRLLSQTCSTSLCDRITFRRNPSDNESTMNRIMMEKFNLFKSENVTWIDLQRISGLPEYSYEHVQKFLEDLDVSDNNINDEFDTPEYRNLNCQLNCGLGPESTVREWNLEPQQHGHENLEIESPSEYDFGQYFSMSPPSLAFVMEPEQRGHVKNLEFGPVSTVPEWNSEPEQGDLLGLGLRSVSTLPDSNAEAEKCDSLNLEVGSVSTLPESNSEPVQHGHVNMEVDPASGLRQYVVEESPVSAPINPYYFTEDLSSAPELVLH